LPPKADILFGAEESPLSAKSYQETSASAP
jgi:hypothetical protein